MNNTSRSKIWNTLEPAGPGDFSSRLCDYFLITLIGMSIVFMMVGTVKSIYLQYGLIIDSIDTIILSIFAGEYIIRLWSCVEDERYKHPIGGRIKWMFNIYSIIDLVVLLPLLVNFVNFDVVTLRVFRMLRLTRALKMARYSSSVTRLLNVFHKTKDELMLTGLLMVALLIISATLLYAFEHTAQPEAFPDAISALWWSVVTLTTVGYGDVYPITPLGKIAAGFISIIGISFVALPAGIISSGFISEIQDSKNKSCENCPHCGEKL
ncbi:MAG: ion transporter [Desulfovibrio sp.]